jgi:hypothetical protein
VPVWGWITIGAGIVLVLAGLTIAAVFAWQSTERRYALRLVGLGEGVDFVRQALADSLGRLAEGTDQELTAFADNPDSIERRALHEVAMRAHLLADELDAMALPRSVVPAADALADAAYLIAKEAGKVHDEALGDEAYEALSSIDLEAVETYYGAAMAKIEELAEACGLEDAAVYGGGLYL